MSIKVPEFCLLQCRRTVPALDVLSLPKAFFNVEFLLLVYRTINMYSSDYCSVFLRFKNAGGYNDFFPCEAYFIELPFQLQKIGKTVSIILN